MASGCVIEYHGKRGDVYRLKFTDATGRQVMETLGPARSPSRPDGLTRKQAEKALRDRLTDVERKKWEKPKPVTFAVYSARWLDEGEQLRQWKPRTVLAYRIVTERLRRSSGRCRSGRSDRATSRPTSTTTCASCRPRR